MSAPWLLSLETRLAIHSDWWAEDRHLGITGDGDLYLVLDDAPARLVGDAEGGVDWPAVLGAEPRWFATEAGYLADLWLDSRRVYA